MLRSLSRLSRWNRRSTTLLDPGSLRVEVRPPSLRCAPAGGIWQRLLFWLMAAPHDASPPLSRLPAVRTEFLATLTDIGGDEAETLRRRINDTRSLRELWHLRTDVYRLVGIWHSQHQAQERVSLLNRHFPTRAPRSQFAVL